MTSSVQHNSAKLIFVRLVCCLCFIFAGGAPALAGELQLKPGLRERITWNDNFFLKDFDGFELRSEPILAANYGTEASQAQISGQLSNYVYSDESKYNRTTYAANGVVNHRFSELLSTTLRGGWSQDYSLESYWDDEGLSTLLQRRNYNAGLSATYSLTELDTFDFSFNWAQLEYEKRIYGYSDYDMLNTSLYWQHAMLDGRVSLIALASWQHLIFDSPAAQPNPFVRTKQDITQNVWQAMAGLNWAPHERLSIKAMVGANHTRSEIENETAIPIINSYEKIKEKENSTGFTGSLDAKLRMDNLTLRAIYEQEHLPSAYGEIRVVNTGSISGIYTYSRRLSFSSSIRYSNSKNDLSATRKISRDIWYYTLQGRYRITEDFTAVLQYSHMNYNNKVSERKEHSNAVFLQFAYELPLNF